MKEIHKNRLTSSRLFCPKVFLPIISGLMLSASFPKADQAWLAWIALTPLFFAIRSVPAKESFRLGFIAGLIHYLTLMYWVVHAMSVYGKLSLIVCLPVLFLFASYLGLYFAGYAACIAGLCKKPLRFAVISPVALVSLEYIRSIIFTGFPWELLGHSQYQSLHLIQISDIIGVYGISFIAASVNGTIFLTVLYLTGKQWQGEPVSRKETVIVLLSAALLLAAVFGYGKWRIGSHENVQDADGVRIAVVQGNIDQMIKWKPAFQKSTVQKYLALTNDAQEAELIVWPETAAPFYFTYDPVLTNMVTDSVKKGGAWLLTGSPSHEKTNGDYDFFNSAFLINPDGVIVSRYDKAHLVPFGEYVPLKKWLPFIGKMVEQVGDFKPGAVGEVRDFGKNRMGVLICYEVIFPYLSRAMVQNGAQFLINITNDAWYGTTSGPYQHFSLTVFRAVENKRPMVRSANTGVSGFIDSLGRIQEITPLFQESVITRIVAPSDEITLYTRFGDVFAQLCAASLLIIIIISTYRRKKLCRQNQN